MGPIMALLLLVASGALADEPAPLALKAQVEVDRESLHLRDLLEAPDEAPEGLRTLLSTPLVTLAPGGSRTLTTGHIRLLMRQARLNPSGIVFTGPDRVTINRPAILTSVVVESAAPGMPTAAVQPQAPTIARGTRVRVKVRIGALAVEADGELLEPSRIGARARLRINDTRAVVTGVLVAPGVAEVVL